MKNTDKQKVATKLIQAAQKYDADIALEILNDAAHFVSRAAHKLEGALREFGIDLTGLLAFLASIEDFYCAVGPNRPLAQQTTDKELLLAVVDKRCQQIHDNIAASYTGEGFDQLAEIIDSLFIDGEINVETDAVVTGARQYAAFKNAVKYG